MRQYALFLAAAVLIGHAGVIVIGGPAIVMCGFDIVCLTTSLRAFPITGVLPDFAFEDLQLLNRATGMTGNAVGGVSGYVLVCAATAICVLLRSDPVRTRVFAAATATSAVTAVAVYVRGGLEIQPTVRRETLEFLAQNTTPLVLVGMASLFILATTPSRPEQAPERLQWRSRSLGAVLRGTSVVLALLTLAELVMAVLVMFAPATGNTVLAAVSGEPLDVSAVMNTLRCTASVLCGMLVLQAAAATDRLRPRALLVFPSATFHLANWFAWLVVVSDLERSSSAVNLVTGLGAGATATVVAALVLFAIDDRQQEHAARAARLHGHELSLLGQQQHLVDSAESSSSSSSVGAVPSRQRLTHGGARRERTPAALKDDADSSSSVDAVPARQRLAST